MNNRTIALRVAASAVCFFVLAGPSFAGGLYVPTFGGPSQGTASAGVNAIAWDASTAYTNPAGMTRLDDHQFLGGLAPRFATVKFDPDDDSPSGTGDGGQQGGFLPISSSSYVHKLSDRWRLGLSLGSVSGAALNPGNDWAGRNEVTDLSLFSLSLIPTVAVRVTDWLSVGAGAAITYARVDMEVRAPLPMLGEPTIKLDKMDDWEAAPVVSVLIEPMDTLRLGAIYIGESDFDLKGKVKLPEGVPVEDVAISLGLPLAQTVRTSIYWEACDTVALMMSGGWEDWSTAKSLPVSVSMGGSAEIPLKFRDTWYLGAGVHYDLNDAWTLQTGFRYDSSALKDSDRTTAFPIDRQWSVGVGVLHHYSEKLRIGLSFQWTDLGRARVNTDNVDGHYKNNDLFLFGVTLAWKKLPWSGWGTL